MSFLDFEEIKAANDIADVAQQLGLELRKSGNSLRGRCPVCESSGDRNLAVTPSKGVFYCFTNGKGGDVISLVAHIRDCSVKEAAQWLSGAPKAKEKEKGGTKPDKGFTPLDYLEHDHEAVIALGFEPDDAERLGIGFAPRGVLRGTVAVPVRLQDGTLSGYIGIQEAKLPPSWRF